MPKLFKLILFIVICEAVGAFGGTFTVSSINDWYQYLNKPFFSPPNWVFGPVWTTLYFLMGASAFLIFQKGYKKPEVKTALNFFILQLIFNFFWSFLFFGFRSTQLGFAGILVLLFFILKTYFSFKKISPLAGVLFIPYIAWVSFASLLNISLVILNP